MDAKGKNSNSAELEARTRAGGRAGAGFDVDADVDTRKDVRAVPQFGPALGFPYAPRCIELQPLRGYCPSQSHATRSDATRCVSCGGGGGGCVGSGGSELNLACIAERRALDHEEQRQRRTDIGTTKWSASRRVDVAPPTQYGVE
uniref:Uncharacterized protein n=1 Tax=Mycena chlorophos TaxID=658473 RepID=A0ABQ0L386_MYCCL|nr:predicted protein [Mycena chlorophos]